MRGIKFASFGFTALMTTVWATSSCTGPSDDCETHLMCPGGGTAGSAGSKSDAGEGNAGTSGTSGGKGGAGSAGSSSGGKSGMSGASGKNSGGEGGAGGMGGGCDTTKSPTEEACLVADDYAVFVAPDGDDDNNDGSQAAPFASLTKAVEVAAGAKLVLVCDATYDEHVVIASGARVYGGFKCTDWSAEAQKPLFKPTTAGPALKIDGVVDEVLLENTSFEVGDATAAGETALAAIVNASPSVTLRAVSLKAGKGKAGAKGTLSPFVLPARTELDGNSATNVITGGAPQPYTCPGGAKTSGGIGGSASPGGQPGGDGTPFLEAGKGKGGTPGSCATGLGGDGANAPDSPAASGAKALGILSAIGWSTGSGGDGANGGPGQGGGGGASSDAGGGSGGGAGACGGAGAKGGQGGGGSIALAVLASAVALETSELATADAGDGGASVAGQSADKVNHKGGFAGTSTGPGACQGGAGGLGGDGAAGGGGAGGISVGIVWKGAMTPTVSADTTITNGKAGAKGTGGAANDGIAGVSQKILAAN